MDSPANLGNPSLDTLRIACQKWAHLFLENKEKAKTFDRNKRVPRVGIENQLTQFVYSDKTATIIVGASGVGKSFLTCSLIEEYLDKGHLVLAYDGSQVQGAVQGSTGGELGRVLGTAIMRSLNFEPSTTLEAVLTGINRVLDQEDKFMFLFFDGVDKFAYAGAKTRELLISLNTMIETCTVHRLGRIKFVITCLSSEWDLLPVLDILKWNLYFALRESSPLHMDKYTLNEFRIAYEKYMGKIPEDDPHWFELVDSICQRDPYVLKIVSELDPISLSKVSTQTVFDGYWMEKVIGAELGVERERFLDHFVAKMLELGSEDVPTKLLDINDQGYQSLVREGILVPRVGEQPFPQAVTHLSHARLSEYLLGRYLRSTYESVTGMTMEMLTSLIEKASQAFLPLWGALATYLGSIGDQEFFLGLAESPKYKNQEMASDGLAEFGRMHPDTVADTLKYLFRRDSARPVALRAALELRRLADVRTEFIQWAFEEPAQAANHVSLLWKEFRETRLGEAIWDELAAIRNEQMHLDIQELRSNESIRFLASAAWRLLVDHCHEETSLNRLSDFLEETWRLILADSRLHKPGVKTLFILDIKRRLREYVSWMLSRFVAEFSSPSPEDVRRSFETGRLPQLPKQPIFPQEMRRIARLLDGQCEASWFEARRNDLLTLISSRPAPETRLQVVVPAIAVAVQVLRNFEKARPTLDYLWDRGGPQEHVILLSAFSIHTTGQHILITPPLISKLKEMTRDLLSEKVEYLTRLDDPWGLARKWDLTLALAPLGFAYCNLPRPLSKPYIVPILELMDEIGASSDIELFRGCIKGMTPIGLYFPEEALYTLERMKVFSQKDPLLVEETRNVLRVIQVFNYRVVNAFLRSKEGEIGAQFEPGRLTGRPLEELLALTQWIGNINFAYRMAWYPIPRCMQIGVLQGLTAEKESINSIIDRFATKLAAILIQNSLSLKELLNNPVDSPEAIIRRIAGKGYYLPKDSS